MRLWKMSFVPGTAYVQNLGNSRVYLLYLIRCASISPTLVLSLLIIRSPFPSPIYHLLMYILSLYSSCSIFLDAFAKLRIATISFVMSVRLSVCMEQLGSHRRAFYKILYLIIFRKFVEKIQLWLKSCKNKVYFT